MVDLLPSVHEVLGLTPNTERKQSTVLQQKTWAVHSPRPCHWWLALSQQANFSMGVAGRRVGGGHRGKGGRKEGE